MSKGSVNKVILVGNLGTDPELRQTSSGVTSANFVIATTEVWKDKQGVQQEKTEWHRVVVFGKLADIVGQYYKKGAKVYAEGRIKTSKYVDKSGVERYSTEILAESVQMLDRANTGGVSSKPAANGSLVEPSPDYEDDIPF